MTEISNNQKVLGKVKELLEYKTGTPWTLTNRSTLKVNIALDDPTFFDRSSMGEGMGSSEEFIQLTESLKNPMPLSKKTLTWSMSNLAQVGDTGPAAKYLEVELSPSSSISEPTAAPLIEADFFGGKLREYAQRFHRNLASRQVPMEIVDRIIDIGLRDRSKKTE